MMGSVLKVWIQIIAIFNHVQVFSGNSLISGLEVSYLEYKKYAM